MKKKFKKHRHLQGALGYVYAMGSAIANKCQNFEADIAVTDTYVLKLSTFEQRSWSQNVFIERYMFNIHNAQIYECSPRHPREDQCQPFYIFAAPQGTGYVGILIGSKQEVFISPKNYHISVQPSNFNIEFTSPIEAFHVQMDCKIIERPDTFKRIEGMFPEVVVTRLTLVDKDMVSHIIEVNNATTWDEIKDDVEKLEKLY